MAIPSYFPVPEAALNVPPAAPPRYTITHLSPSRSTLSQKPESSTLPPTTTNEPQQRVDWRSKGALASAVRLMPPTLYWPPVNSLPLSGDSTG
jgi:hypothetical protein